jgi:hypothetical protein
MSITASIALTPSTVVRGQVSNAAVTVNNASGSAVTVTLLEPYATASSGATTQSTQVNLGRPAISQGQNITVAGSSSAVFNFGLVATGPNGSSSGYPTSPSTQTVVIGAQVAVSDGSTATATTANLTVNAPAAT